MLNRDRKFVGKRQYIENSKSPAKQRLAATRIPGKAHARLEIAKRRISKKGPPHDGGCVGEMAPIGDQVIRLGSPRDRFIRQSGVESQVFFQPHTILYLCAEQR